MLITAFLLAAAQPQSAIARLSDAEICQSMHRVAASVRGSAWGPVTLVEVRPDCETKTVTSRMALSGDKRADFMANFTAAADANLCHGTQPPLVAFRERGWRWVYQFSFADGTAETTQIAC